MSVDLLAEIRRTGPRPGWQWRTRWKSLHDRVWEKVDVRSLDECWPWQGSVSVGGYGRIQVGGRPEMATRVIWALAHGEDPRPLHILHHCDNPPCCNPLHLFKGTTADNHADRDRKGRNVRGERVNTAKLTESDVRAIRAEAVGAERGDYSAIARKYGITGVMVGLIVRRQSWKHVRD